MDKLAAARVAQKEWLAKSDSELISEARLDVGGVVEGKIAKRLSQMPPLSKRTYLKAMRGKSMAAGIKANCMECIGWERIAVRRCTSPACPLYPYRPFRHE